ncbi:MAG TPA: tRNA lysidine(34) synthetase TilS [Candidatus Azoamicus sp. OHIO2]
MNLDKFYFSNLYEKLILHKHVYIGYSGGIDSSVLLDLSCRILRKKHMLKVIHINHSYSSEANAWSFFCKNICNKYHVGLYTYTFKNIVYKDNLEENFRVVRFNFILNTLMKNTTLLLAQHTNDLVETIFMRMIRGSGVVGILSIKNKNRIGQVNIVRPLLNITKLDIISYALLNNIPFIIDKSNYNKKLSRNYIRFYIDNFFTDHIINKRIILRYLNLNSNIVRYVNKFLYFFIKCSVFNYKSLHVSSLINMSKFLLKELLRAWISFNNYKMPSYIILIELIKIIKTRVTHISFIHIDNYSIVKFKNNIYIKSYGCDVAGIRQAYLFVYLNIIKNNMFILYGQSNDIVILKKNSSEVFE